MTTNNTPEILAPAGDRQSLWAAVQAGADAVYVGLKHFSARMQAGNFSVKELARCRELLEPRGVKLYVAMNSLVKPGDEDAAGRLVDRLARQVAPHALICQDLAFVELARQTGFTGELHLSTLANVSHPKALAAARDLGASRVIVPRELDLEELKAMDAACPEGLDLEIFVHGALCYCVSGRCWWSSFLGGKSGLRGRCVQPCRRAYGLGAPEPADQSAPRKGGGRAHKQKPGRRGRFFSCRDLSLDVLAKTLAPLSRLKAWKIEGRKKGPHYVYYAVSAYRILADAPEDPQAKKMAQSFLEQALSRPTTKSRFLPHKMQNPVAPDDSGEPDTASGRKVGVVKSEAPVAAKAKVKAKGKPGAGPGASPGPKAGRPAPAPKTFQVQAYEALLPGDLLRLGAEDEAWHQTIKVRGHLPKRGTLSFRPEGKRPPKSGVAVYLVDRREPELTRLLEEMETTYKRLPEPKSSASSFNPTLPRPLARVVATGGGHPPLHTVRRRLPPGKSGKAVKGLWLSQGSLAGVSKTLFDRLWWWLPPVVWPDEEAALTGLIQAARRGGARRFVCNAPWQRAFFDSSEKIDLMAGPFCNTANTLALGVLADMGFGSAVAAPELHQEDFAALAATSPLPLGAVTRGLWPLGISRHLPGVKAMAPLSSPKREVHFVKRYGQNAWLFPNRPLDLEPFEEALSRAGFAFFVAMPESLPGPVPEADTPSTFNWNNPLL